MVGVVPIASELFLRLAGRQSLFNSTSTAYFSVKDPFLGFKNRPNGRFHNRDVKTMPVITTDEFGLRNGIGCPSVRDAPKIVFIGDSTTFCSEVADDETISSSVAKELMSKGVQVGVLNAGVRGFGTLQATRILSWVLETFENVSAAVYTACGNDFVENVYPLLHYPAEAPTVSLDLTGESLDYHEVSSSYLETGTKVFGVSSLYRLDLGVSGKALRFLAGHSALTQLLPSSQRTRLLDWSLGDVEFQLRNGETLSRAASWNEIRAWSDSRDTDAVFRLLLRQMNELCKRHKTRLIVVPFATGGADCICSCILNHCRALAITAIDIRQYFTQDPTFYMSEQSDGSIDPHYGPNGTATYGRAVSSTLISLFENTRTGSNMRMEL